MKHPIWWALGAGVAVVVAAFVPPLWQTLQRAPGPASGAAAEQGLPWQVQPLPDGSARVMGIHLGVDTLAQAQARVGDNLQLALVARLGEVGALEALAEPFAAGFVSGRLVLAFDVPPATLARWRAAVSGSTPMDGGVRRFSLRAADLAEARAMPLAGLSFVPGVRLSEDDVRQRFGPPASVQALDGGGQLLRYPALGLAATVAPGQRGLLQYVAPRDMAARLGAVPVGATTRAP